MPAQHSGFECSNCGETRWGGVTFPSGPRVIGYRFSNGSHLCWRCQRKFKPPDDDIPLLPYLSGGMEPLYNVPGDGPPYDYEHKCDECGVLIEKDY